jgi:hypothetical protein
MQMKSIAISLCVFSTMSAATSHALSYYLGVSANSGEIESIGIWDGPTVLNVSAGGSENFANAYADIGYSLGVSAVEGIATAVSQGVNTNFVGVPSGAISSGRLNFFFERELAIECPGLSGVASSLYWESTRIDSLQNVDSCLLECVFGGITQTCDATTSGCIQVNGEINIIVGSPTALLTSQDAVDLDLSFSIPFEIEGCSELDDALTTTDLLVAEVANALFTHGLPRLGIVPGDDSINVGTSFSMLHRSISSTSLPFASAHVDIRAEVMAHAFTVGDGYKASAQTGGGPSSSEPFAGAAAAASTSSLSSPPASIIRSLTVPGDFSEFPIEGVALVFASGHRIPLTYDTDGDAVPDEEDPCVDDWDPAQADTDGDGVGDACDNCTQVANPGQQDIESDGCGNVCDGDFNDNGITDPIDMTILKATYLKSLGQPGYDARADMNSDDVVSASDLNLFKQEYLGIPGPGNPDCAY